MMQQLEAPVQKNKRLSQSNREDLYRFARKQVEATAESSALNDAYEHAAEAVHAAVVAKYPQKDMAVLARYDVASEDACIYVSSGHYNYDRFCFRDGDKRIPLRPGSNCNRSAFLLEGDALAAYEAFKDAEKAHKAECSRRLNDFNALISGAKTFNEVTSIWPAAEVLRESIVGTGTSLTVLSNDVVSRIQSDPAASALQEAA